jgi:hypothetical protein
METLRHELFGIPGKLVSRSRKNVLVMPVNYPHQEEFLAAALRVKKLKVPRPDF